VITRKEGKGFLLGREQEELVGYWMDSEGMASAGTLHIYVPEVRRGGEEADGVLHVRSAVEEGRGGLILGSIERYCGFLSHHAGFCCRSVLTLHLYSFALE
jgi:hypothetical protein